MPFSSTNMNQSRMHGNAGAGFGPQGFAGNFYNQQVYKPIRGGGGKQQINRERANTEMMNFSQDLGYKTNFKTNDNRINDPNMKDNRFRSENRGAFTKKDMKKQKLMNIQGFVGNNRDSRNDVKSA